MLTPNSDTVLLYYLAELKSNFLIIFNYFQAEYLKEVDEINLKLLL